MTEQEKYNTFNVLEILKIDNMTEEIIASSALEGEELDKVQVENSVIKFMLEDKMNNLDIELDKNSESDNNGKCKK